MLQELKRATQDMRIAAEVGIPGREDGTGGGDNIAVERDEESFELPQTRSSPRITALPNDIHAGVSQLSVLAHENSLYAAVSAKNASISFTSSSLRRRSPAHMTPSA